MLPDYPRIGILPLLPFCILGEGKIRRLILKYLPIVTREILTIVSVINGLKLQLIICVFNNKMVKITCYNSLDFLNL